MTNITLYGAPGSCSKVPTILLEEIGVPYQLEVVRFMKGEHKSPAFKAHNPKGKIPALVVDGEALTENPIIARHLHLLFPEAQLLPKTHSLMEESRQIADLCFCSSTLHPIVTRIRMPQFFAPPEQGEQVWAIAAAAMDEYFALIETRLAEGTWWYGDTWSAMDAYLYWVFWRVEGANYDVSRFPLFTAHARCMEQRPAVQRAIAKEHIMGQTLAAEGLVFKPPSFGTKK